MMSKKISKIILVGITTFILQVSLLSAEPIQLQSDDVVFPIAITFPIFPQSVQVPNPAVPKSMFYFFTAQDEDIMLTYAVVIMNIPEDLGRIPIETARMMINQSLDTQISNIDDLVGVTGKVIKEDTDPFNGYPSKYLEIIRETNPQLRGLYHAVFVDRLLITAWASGLDTENNRFQAEKFIQSLRVGDQINNPKVK